MKILQQPLFSPLPSRGREDAGKEKTTRAFLVGSIFLEDTDILDEAIRKLIRALGLGTPTDTNVQVVRSFGMLPMEQLEQGDIVVIPRPDVLDEAAGQVRPNDEDVANLCHITGGTCEWFLDLNGHIHVRVR